MRVFFLQLLTVCVKNTGLLICKHWEMVICISTCEFLYTVRVLPLSQIFKLQKLSLLYVVHVNIIVLDFSLMKILTSNRRC